MIIMPLGNFCKSLTTIYVRIILYLNPKLYFLFGYNFNTMTVEKSRESERI